MEETQLQEPLVCWRKHSAVLRNPWPEGGGTGSLMEETQTCPQREDHSTSTEALNLKEENSPASGAPEVGGGGVRGHRLPALRSPPDRFASSCTMPQASPQAQHLSSLSSFVPREQSITQGLEQQFGSLRILEPRKDLPGGQTVGGRKAKARNRAGNQQHPAEQALPCSS